MEFFSCTQYIYFLDFDTVDRLESIFHIDLCSARIDIACIYSLDLTVGRFVGDGESLDDCIERIHGERF